jgi:hypothetical protein
VAQVKTLLPEGRVVALHNKGITELPLARFNARLAPHGYTIRATKGHNSRRLVACINEEGRVEQFGLFELRSLAPERLCGTDSEQSKERERRHAKGGG